MSLGIKKSPAERDAVERCATLSGASGIICNVVLCAAKLAVGLLSGSVAVLSDAFNNLSDAAVNIVTIAGVKLSRKPVDREHPFGHGRVEYIAALIVAFSIFAVGAELFKESVFKIINPEPLGFDPVFAAVLAGAVGVKLWMAFFNHRLYKRSGSVTIKAVRQDSLNDCVATSATIAALVCSNAFGLRRLDGIVGAAVAVFVFFSGIGILRDILNPLLGQAPSRETTCKIEELILNNSEILGVHDIIVHSYGAGNVIASAHAEVRSDMELVAAHVLVDSIEREILDKLGINITIHVDPVVVHDEKTERYRRLARELIGGYEGYSFHDLRLTQRDGKDRLSVEVVIPFEEKDCEKVREELSIKLKALCPEADPDVTVEHSFV